jgi:antitoxin YefM
MNFSLIYCNWYNYNFDIEFNFSKKIMKTITYTSLRNNLSSVLNEIENDQDVYNVKRKNHEDIVMIPKSDYDSLKETLYLLSNPHNAKNLNDSIEQDQEGEYESIDLDS